MRARALRFPCCCCSGGASAARSRPPETKLASRKAAGKPAGRHSPCARARPWAPGQHLTATARYPAVGPTTQLSGSLERTPEFALAKFQLDVEGRRPVPTVILAAGSGARLIVRTVAKGSESGRELPGGPDVVLLDEGVHSLFVAVADLATPAGPVA